MLVASDSWKSAFPGAVVGALVMRGVHNPEQSAPLEVHKWGLEEDLRARSAGCGVRASARTRWCGGRQGHHLERRGGRTAVASYRWLPWKE